MKAPYHPAAPEPSYDALLVFLLARRNGALNAPELQQLELKLVFLEAYKPPSLWTLSDPIGGGR